MNIPEIYLIEPYNAYTNQKGGRKKHWHEVIEEQALLQRILAEQQALQEASSKTLPPTSPSIAAPTVGNMSAGAGGSPPSQFFNPGAATVNFSRTPANGDGPVTIGFSNLTSNPELYTFLWIFGDGTTSNAVNPTHLYQSQSTAANSWTASLQATNSVTLIPAGSSSNLFISASKPTVVASFTLTTSSVSASLSTTTFFNVSTNSSQTPTTTYLWVFGSGSLTSTLANPAPLAYTVTGPYTASLQVTGSYNISSSMTRSFFLL